MIIPSDLTIDPTRNENLSRHIAFQQQQKWKETSLKCIVD